MRGDLLKRLVALRLLQLEAVNRGLADSTAFRRELEAYRIARLYRYYIQKLRDQLVISEEVDAELKEKFKGQADALAAARSSWLVEEYRKLRLATLQLLRDRQHVIFFNERITEGIGSDTVLMQGDELMIRYGDLVQPGQFPQMPEKEWIEERLYQRAELLLFAHAAANEGGDIADQLEAFRRERLPALLVEQLEQEWIPDEKTLRDYFDASPELGYVPERWHAGQLVVSSYAQAAALRKRIQQGASLFNLAGRYSIDPYGRDHNGDMGWFKEGEGNPQRDSRDETMQRLAAGWTDGIDQRGGSCAEDRHSGPAGADQQRLGDEPFPSQGSPGADTHAGGLEREGDPDELLGQLVRALSVRDSGIRPLPAAVRRGGIAGHRHRRG